jgi:hypothetical protein
MLDYIMLSLDFIGHPIMVDGLLCQISEPIVGTAESALTSTAIAGAWMGGMSLLSLGAKQIVNRITPSAQEES